MNGNWIENRTEADEYTYEYIVRMPDGGLRLYSQECCVDEEGDVVSCDEPVDLTDAIDLDELCVAANSWGLDTEHGNPDDCIVGEGETLVAHRLYRNPE